MVNTNKVKRNGDAENKTGILNKDQLAAYFNRTRRWLEIQMKKGLPYYKIGRSVYFNLAEVLRYLDKYCRHGRTV